MSVGSLAFRSDTNHFAWWSLMTSLHANTMRHKRYGYVATTLSQSKLSPNTNYQLALIQIHTFLLMSVNQTSIGDYICWLSISDSRVAARPNIRLAARVRQFAAKTRPVELLAWKTCVC